MAKLVEEEYTLALSLADLGMGLGRGRGRGEYGLHDPDAVRMFFEFLAEDTVLAGKVVCSREEVVVSGVIKLSFPLEVPLVTLEVLDEVVFTTELMEIGQFGGWEGDETS